MATPALSLMREGFPDAHISVLAKRAGARFFERLPQVDEVIEFPAEKWIDRRRLALLPMAVPSVVRLMVGLYRARFDGVVLWRDNAVDTTIARWTGARVRASVSHDYLWCSKVERSRWLQFSLDRELAQEGLHLSELMCIPVRRLLAQYERKPSSVDVPSLDYPIASAERGWVSAFLRENQLEVNKFIQISISSGTRYNRWSVDKWAELISILHRETRLPILIEGLGRDRMIEAAIIEGTKAPIVRGCGKLGLGEVGATIDAARVLVSFNSAPIHMAAALGTPVVVIGGRDGFAMSPWKTRHIIVTRNGYYPERFKNRQNWGKLTDRIEPCEVAAAVMELL